MQSETEALLLRLTEAQKDCPGDPIWSHLPDCAGGCEGTGKVPLFPDTVREECPRCNGRGRIYGGAPTEDGYICPDCKGRGKVPSTDPMLWVAALHDLQTACIESQEWPILEYGNPLAATLADTWHNYENMVLRGDFDAALPHAVKALELAGILEVANEPAR